MNEKNRVADLLHALPRRLMAMIWMVFGSLAVLGLVFAMNNAVTGPKKQETRTQVAFKVEKQQKQPRKMKMKKPRPKPRKSVQKTRQAPLPKITGSLSGMSFGIPEFDAAAVGKIGDSLLGNVKDLVMTEDAVDDPPRVRSHTEVQYPASARARDITGYVTLSLLVNERGEVEKAKVLEAQPAGIFEEAASASVKQWRFDPAFYQGNAVRVWVKQTVHFKLI